MTQGMVSVVRDGAVQMKIIAGCNGMTAPTLAHVIRASNQIPSPQLAYRTALQLLFGCRNCLVILTKADEMFYGSGQLEELYRRTFGEPQFNPRWELGTADRIEIVEL